MIRLLPLSLIAATLLASCATEKSYRPLTKAEKLEYSAARQDIYPNDVRGNLDLYTNATVAWAGIILNTDAHEEDLGGRIRASTLLAHHYFDWVQDVRDKNGKLVVSPRGEGNFRIDWHLVKKDPNATAGQAEKFAGKGRLAIVYGVPQKIDPDGTIVLEYHYLRVIDRDHFVTNAFDYGRYGEPFRAMQTTNAGSLPR